MSTVIISYHTWCLLFASYRWPFVLGAHMVLAELCLVDNCAGMQHKYGVFKPLTNKLNAHVLSNKSLDTLSCVRYHHADHLEVLEPSTSGHSICLTATPIPAGFDLITTDSIVQKQQHATCMLQCHCELTLTSLQL
jgi:hypothetical protein